MNDRRLRHSTSESSGNSGPARRAAGPEDPVESGAPVHWNSESLFRGAREIVIEHAGKTYRLRQTRYGKLILNK